MQVVETPEGVVLKRGSNEVMIAGANAAQAVRTVLDATTDGVATLDDIRGLFPRSPTSQVDTLVKSLIERGLLVAADNGTASFSRESPLDIFFWHFGTSLEEVMKRLNTIRVTIVGVNTISRQLTYSLMASGHKSFSVVDHPNHRNMRLFEISGRLKEDEWPASLMKPQPWKDGMPSDLGTCLVATSDFGGQQALCEWNNLCIDRKIHFLPVVLKNMIGYVGPIIVPGETACYACLISRQKSHSAAPDADELLDKAAFQGQSSNGFHPSMPSMLGDLACFELTKFYCGALPGRKGGRLLEMNLLAGTMTGRTIVKLPRCAVCSPLRKMSRTDLRTILYESTSNEF